MQLVAYGAQDVYLTGNPQITFFKVVYRRHTNFACEAIEQTFNGTPAFGGKATVPITRNGDLVTKMWLKTDIKSTDNFAKVHTSATTTAVYALGTASSTNAGNTASITCANSGYGEITITLAAGSTALSAANAPVGGVIRIQGVTNYNGYYVVTTVGNNTVAKVAALAMDVTDPINGTVSSGKFHDGTGSPADSATLTVATAIVTTYKDAEAFEYVDDLGYALINSVELQIGGTKIDKHYGRWMHIWSQLTKTAGQEAFYGDCINAHHAEWGDASKSRTLYVPLQFFCCRNDGLALPLIALQYHDVRLEFEFETAANCCVSASKSGNISLSNTTLLVNYIYLDSEERKRFAQASHEYLIEQLQFTGVETVAENTNGNKVRLNFNHPVKELVWAVQNADDGTKTKFVNYGDNSSHNPVTRALLQLNGHDRFSEQDGLYFNRVQPNQHHSRQPSDGINVYSFALNPEEHQPSGTCNFSRIDNATLTVDLANNSGSNMYVYGVNYNVLRIMSGMGGVAYSN
jgi:hypothetical protein